MTVLAVLDRGVPATSEAAVGVARRLADQLAAPVVGALDPGSVPPESAAAGLTDLLAELAPSAVLAPATDRGTEVMAHLAAQAGLPLAANCTAITPTRAGGADDTDGWIVTRLRGGGVLLEEAELVAGTKLLTVAAGATVNPLPSPATITEASAGQPLPADHATVARHAELSGLDGVEMRDLKVAEAAAKVRLVDRTTAQGGVSLATAPVVVSGGRGIGSAEGFAVLEELAELLGGAVGCSRVATNNGWRPHSDQVGQTGTKVNPELYIAAGISGATQHWAGCMGAKTILAINTDPEAPMMTRAHYAVVGDALEVLRAVTDEIRARRSL
ncbi:MAG TPA: electron transfer flavoprotein subunit alpha/FixB family protein [Jiangellaceae bacterium]|nr:electron transfer flavoprotein subunit alpha/FixB family protein [Jiangellaceae bacterium]